MFARRPILGARIPRLRFGERRKFDQHGPIIPKLRLFGFALMPTPTRLARSRSDLAPSPLICGAGASIELRMTRRSESQIRRCPASGRALSHLLLWRIQSADKQ
jgi:hypothetical protein